MSAPGWRRRRAAGSDARLPDQQGDPGDGQDRGGPDARRRVEAHHEEGGERGAGHEDDVVGDRLERERAVRLLGARAAQSGPR
jgi:hypothetical protein